MGVHGIHQRSSVRPVNSASQPSVTNLHTKDGHTFDSNILSAYLRRFSNRSSPPLPVPAYLSPAMCHGHPHYHSCGHQSVTWHYCPSALIDLTTGYETPCPSITFAASQSSTTACPLANCDFRSTGTLGWTCCKCGGWNDSGWCKNVFAEPKWNKNPITNEWEWMERCDHGCCRNCTKDSKSGS